MRNYELIDENYKRWYSAEARAEHKGERYKQISNDMLIADLDDMAQIFSGLNFAEWNFNTEAKKHWNRMLEIVKSRLNHNYDFLTKYKNDDEIYFDGDGKWYAKDNATWGNFKSKLLAYAMDRDYNLTLIAININEKIDLMEDWEIYNNCKIVDVYRDDNNTNVIVKIVIE